MPAAPPRPGVRGSVDTLGIETTLPRRLALMADGSEMVEGWVGTPSGARGAPRGVIRETPSA